MAKKGFKLPGVSPLKQEGDKFGLPSFDRSGYRSSGGSYSSPQDPSTYFTPGGYFAEGISSFGNIASEYIKNQKPEVNPDGSIGNFGGAKTNKTFATNLDKRIAAAEAKGDKSKVEKLEGKKQRRAMRDTTQAAINEKKNTEREAKLQKRLNERLTNKGIDPSTVSMSKGSEYKELFANMASNLGVQSSLDTSTDGTALEMKEKSPLGFIPGQQIGQPQAFSFDVPMQANMMGTAKPVFNQQTMGMAEAAFGNPTMRQASVGSAFQVTAKQEAAFGPDSKLAKEDPAQAKKIYDGIKAGDNSPAASTYENPTPVVDYSGGYVAAKALDTFGNVFADAVTAKYGNKEKQE